MRSRIAVAFFICFAGAVAFFFIGFEAQKNKSSSSSDSAPRLPERELPSVPDSFLAQSQEKSESYEMGYQTGYRAFLIQTGQEAPAPAVRYVSSEGATAESEEQMMKGYVDGYHKASDMMQCPRQCQY